MGGRPALHPPAGGAAANLRVPTSATALNNPAKLRRQGRNRRCLRSSPIRTHSPGRASRSKPPTNKPVISTEPRAPPKHLARATTPPHRTPRASGEIPWEQPRPPNVIHCHPGTGGHACRAPPSPTGSLRSRRSSGGYSTRMVHDNPGRYGSSVEMTAWVNGTHQRYSKPHLADGTGRSHHRRTRRGDLDRGHGSGCGCRRGGRRPFRGPEWAGGRRYTHPLVGPRRISACRPARQR